MECYQIDKFCFINYSKIVLQNIHKGSNSVKHVLFLMVAASIVIPSFYSGYVEGNHGVAVVFGTGTVRLALTKVLSSL
jgi:hypothetical protein